MDSILHTRLRSSSESSTASRASSASATSTTAITKNIPGLHEDSDDDDLSQVDALHGDNLADIPDDVLGPPIAPGKEPRNWKRILLFVLPPVVVVVALSLSLGLYFGLRQVNPPIPPKLP